MTRLMSGVFAVVAVAAGAYAISGLSGQNRLPENPLIGAAYAQDAEVDTSAITEMVQGAEDAPVTLIEYASYTCPHCANFHTGPYKKLKEEEVLLKRGEEITWAVIKAGREKQMCREEQKLAEE